MNSLLEQRPIWEPPAEFGCHVAGLGCALPKTSVPNERLVELLGVSSGWIVDRTGVRARRWADHGERLSDLATRAAQNALAHAGVAPHAVDLVLVATTRADDILPNAAPLVAGGIGARCAAAMDVGAACSGFVSTLALACGLIESGRCGTALIVGADLMSRLLDVGDRGTAALFGDGAGALVLTAVDGPGSVGRFVFGSDADGADYVYARHDACRIVMNGHDTFRAAVARLSSLTRDCARVNGLELADIDLFVYHQANARILRAVAERLGIESERVVESIAKLGNTSAASIPLTLDEALRAGTLREGSRVLVAAFGAGLTWGGTVLEWPPGLATHAR